MKISESIRSSIRFFTYYYVNQTLGFVTGISKLSNRNYLEEMLETPSNVEMLYAVFTNNLEVDEEGTVTNFEYSTKRAAQFLATCLYDKENHYTVEPPFEDWETELH
jgi:hypothetical protein